MGTGVYFNLPAHGHINPTLPLVQELVNRGERIIYYSTAAFQTKIEAVGAEFRDYDSDMAVHREGLGNFVSLAGLLLKATERAVPAYSSDVKQLSPDYILHDAMCPWGKYIAHHLDIKAVNTISTFVFTPDILSESGLFRARIAKMIKEIGLAKSLGVLWAKNKLSRRYHIHTDITDLFRNEEALNLVFTSQYFQPAGPTFGDKYKFIGPSIAERHDASGLSWVGSEKKPLVYISLGTLAQDKIAFFEQCIAAFANLDFAVLISTGNRIDKDAFGQVPENIRVMNFVPQLDVLKQAALFISHGGMNSVNESLYFGVPMLLFPQQTEQAMVARRVQELGAGLVMDEGDMATSLYDTASRILHDSTFYEQAGVIRQSFQDAGGYLRGANLVLDYVKGI